MRIIKLNAIDSTNSYLRQLSTDEVLEDFTVVMAHHQTKGRGQMGTQWESQNAKNLMFSVFKEVSNVNISSHFYLSMAVSLAVFDALNCFKLRKLHIKWPNDILSEQFKLSGILIENVIKQCQIQSSIIGIGININQTQFDNLPKATSMKRISGHDYNIDEVLQEVLKQLNHYFALVEAKSYDVIKHSYESKLFRKNKPSTFKDENENLFSGYIKGVNEFGHLQVLVEDDNIKTFDLKEIQLLY